MIWGGTASILNYYLEKPSWFWDIEIRWISALVCSFAESWTWLSLSSCLWPAHLQSVIVPSATVTLVFLDCLFAHLSYYAGPSMTSQFAFLCDVEMFHLCFTNTDGAFWHRDCQPGYFFQTLRGSGVLKHKFFFSHRLWTFRLQITFYMLISLDKQSTC